MGFLRVVRAGLFLAAPLAAVVPAASALPGAASPPFATAPITVAQSGATFRIRKGHDATLRLSNRWTWAEPTVSTRAVELAPVEYFVDPGYREWRIHARVRGTARIETAGRRTGPTKQFSLTLRVV